MPLSVGDKLGPYEILALIGEGGMGEVYRARDTNLGRDAAIKVLPAAMARDADRLARFEREAKVLAALNHPNIAAIYGLEETATKARAIVMEMVEGPTLADRIQAGPLELKTSLEIALPIAGALEAAHDKGIVHRDLKPANVKAPLDGIVKVLDLGLATALPGADRDSTDAANSPTLTMGATEAGMIMGTAGYMSPEQASGRRVDKRADIWSFGVVLWEMLTGKRLFDGGETVSHTLADVLRAEIDFRKLPAGTPKPIRGLLKRCLDRDVKTRLRDIGEARVVIARWLANPESGTEVTRRTAAQPARHWIPWVVAAVGIIAALVLAYLHFKPSQPPIVTRFPVTLGEGQQFSTAGHMFLDISPDGSQIAYVANARLYMRSMSDLTARAIPGTDFGTAITNPVFSPDGKSLAFHVNGDKTLRRIAVSGGAPVTICPIAEIPSGVSWGDDGIVFAQPNKGILRVNPNGGTPELLVPAKENEQIEGPQMLPGGKAILMTIAEGGVSNTAAWEKARIVVHTLKSGARKTLVEGGSDGRYLPTGHLVYALGGVLFALHFDAGRQEITPGPVGIVEGVSRVNTGSAQFAFSNTGSMIYVAGPVSGLAAGSNVLALVDRKGEAQPLKLPLAGYDYPRLSRDGKTVAYQIDEGKESSIWIYPLSGAIAPRALTLPGSGSNHFPIWSPDGEWVAFQSDREGDSAIWRQRADGSNTAERLTKPNKGESQIPDSWSPDGQTVSFTSRGQGGSSVWTFSQRDKKATLFAENQGSFAGWSSFSPDGHWLAYSGDNRIYVKPFPPTATQYPAPHVDGDHHTLWSPDGKELFYEAGNRRLVTVNVIRQPGSSLSFGPPVETRSGFLTHAAQLPRSFDILPGGTQFIGMVLAGATASSGTVSAPQIQVVLNWFEEVKQRVPGR